jgi:energy-coupling factor transporter ATP-binding protein EcfA2
MLPDIRSYADKEFLAFLGIEDAPPLEGRVLVITGENASGKSFFRRLYAHFISKLTHGDESIEVMTLSMEARSEGGIRRVFLYGGSEEDEATGALTLKNLRSGWATSRDRDTPHIIIWDEPELGLSEESQISAARFIQQQCNDWPKNLLGVIFMTHSRIIVQEVMKTEGSAFLNLGGRYATAESWLNRQIVPRDIEEIIKDNRTNGFAVSHLIAERKRRKNSSAA